MNRSSMPQSTQHSPCVPHTPNTPYAPCAWLTRPARVLCFAALACAAWLPGASVHAQDASQAVASTAQASAPQTEMQEASAAAKASQILGPADIALGEQAQLKLPANMVWIPQPAAGKMMQAMGNGHSDRLLGLIFPTNEGQDWMVVAQFESSGYIKDDDAKNWNIDDLFKSLQEGTEAANEERKRRGFPEIEIIGWVEKPTYDATHHRLVWSMSAKDKGAPGQTGAGINYNTYALGRDGYITLNLITSLPQVGQDKAHAGALLSALSFKDGKRYADFDASTDRTAEYGLAALVGGVAAKKLGFFALAAGFFAKFAKVILLAGIGVLGLLGKFFKRDKA
jgi:uncharacterized membrane-anchored protein